MSDDGDRICPLCAEEMDPTDQQLKPCKCGYEICVWCWHHIMEMAEKDVTEGRCPACRTPYDKERIVGTAAKCERMVAEVNAERRHKSQKTKPKTSAEARKHLSSVRVVQRNLVYVIGVPSNLSDESLLERKEYFGQYGKVLKVSISRPAGAAAQQASNTNTFSVYITYAREEEAIRCIQAVHNFVLEGKPLRACFGTTKYCHAWLRNMPCSNPDCLYLHEVGSQEDSFTKDEIISAYTRSRVPQIASSNLQRRSGNVLPPPADDSSNCVTVSGSKTAVKSVANNTTSHIKGSSSNSGKSTVLPAAASWGMRASNCRPLVASIASSQTPVKQKIETPDSSSTLSSMNTSTKQTSAWHDDDVITLRIPEGGHSVHMGGISRPSGSSQPDFVRDCQTTVSDGSSEVHQIEPCTSGASAWDDDVATTSKTTDERHLVNMNGRSRPIEPLRFSVDRGCQTSGLDVSLRTISDACRSSLISLSCSSSPPPSAPVDNEIHISVPGNNTHLVNGTSPGTLGRQSIGSGPDEVFHDFTAVTGTIQSLCSGISSLNIDKHLEVDHSNIDEHQSSASNLCSTGMPKNSVSRLQQCYADNRVEGLDSVVLAQSSVLSSAHGSRELSDWNSESQKQVLLSAGNEMEDPLLTVDDQRHRSLDVNNQTSCSSYLNHPLSVTNYLSNCSWNNDVGSTRTSVDGDCWTLERNVDKSLLPLVEDESIVLKKQDSLSNFYKPEKVLEFPEMNFTDDKVKCLGRFDDEANIEKRASVDIGESSIISDILSLDFDPWDDSSSANDFAKLLGESNKQDSSHLLSSPWKSLNSNQSRFSFARQENQANLLEPSLREVSHTQKSFSSLYEPHRDGFQNGSLFSSFEVPNAIVDDNPVVSSIRHAGASRAKISAPPGFSLPSKAPPPGFSFHDRYDQAYETTYSENNLHGSSSLGNQYQVQQPDNMADVEFIDPAILAVGRGRMPLGVNNSSLGLRSSFPAQLSTSEIDPRLQLVMQQSVSSHQNQRISDHIEDRFLPLNDAYTTSQFFGQNRTNLSPFAHLSLQQPRNSHVSSNQWDGWNDIQTVNNVGMPEILRNERFGLNNYYSGNEEHKFHIASAADLYNRAFGM